MKRFSHYEIHRCVEFSVEPYDPSSGTYVEQVDSDEEMESLHEEATNMVRVFWTLFGRYEPSEHGGGLETIADRKHRDEAVELLEAILGRHLTVDSGSGFVIEPAEGPEKQVTIDVSGGVADVMYCDPGVNVKILDWDNCPDCGGDVTKQCSTCKEKEAAQ